jgi:signal transduction histidine kinase
MDNIKPELFSKTCLLSQDGSLAWNETAKQVFQALGVSAVLFDDRLRILDSTPGVSEFLASDPRLDAALSQSADSAAGNHWTGLLTAALASDRPARFPAVRCTASGRALTLNLTCIPFADPEPNRLGTLLVENVTETADQLDSRAHADRLAAIGKLCARVAHEMNNPLDGILRYLNLALRVLEQGQPDKAVEYLHHCRGGVQRMARILGELLEFSHSPHLTSEQAPLDRLLEDALRALAPALADVQVRLDRRCVGPGPSVRSDSLFQVFCNLIKNAADAMEGKGRLTITLDRAGPEWTVALRDTGPGFPPEHADDLFKPFFTTKPYGRGTGLGLAICRDILQKHGGRIAAQNVPGGGSCFTVILPDPPAAERNPRP